MYIFTIKCNESVVLSHDKAHEHTEVIESKGHTVPLCTDLLAVSVIVLLQL